MRHWGFAHGGLPNRGLANWHLADVRLFVDGLRVWQVGSRNGIHHGKRCTCYEQIFTTVFSPQDLEATSRILQRNSSQCSASL